MGLCQYVYLCFHAISLPCSHTFWHAIPTSFYIFNVFKSCGTWIETGGGSAPLTSCGLLLGSPTATVQNLFVNNKVLYFSTLHALPPGA